MADNSGKFLLHPKLMLDALSWIIQCNSEELIVVSWVQLGRISERLSFHYIQIYGHLCQRRH
jgi:hypothetical protein